MVLVRWRFGFFRVIDVNEVVVGLSEWQVSLFPSLGCCLLRMILMFGWNDGWERKLL